MSPKNVDATVEIQQRAALSPTLPATVLLDRIRKQREAAEGKKKRGRRGE